MNQFLNSSTPGFLALDDRMRYTENVPKYQSCRDVQTKDYVKNDECISGLVCHQEGYLLDDYGKLVSNIIVFCGS